LAAGLFRAGTPERADVDDLSPGASGRESETAISRAVQAAGPDRFAEAMKQGMGGILDDRTDDKDAPRAATGGLGSSLLDA